jgi:DNA polymerase III epsilon subunit-like protein
VFETTMEHWIALDLETTGLSPTRHQIRELAAVSFGIHDESDAVVHLGTGDLDLSPRRGERKALSRFLRMLGEECVFVAHNAAFDLAFLAEALRRRRLGPFALRGYCTLRLAREVLPDLEGYDLGALQAALGLEGGKRHVALSDARAAAAVFQALVQRAGIADQQALQALHGPPLRVGAASLGGLIER